MTPNANSTAESTTTVPAHVGFVGLGTMGLPMALRLAATTKVRGYDTHTRSAESARTQGLEIADGLEELAAWSEVVVCMLPGPEAVWSVVAEQGGLVGGLAPDTLAINMSTCGPQVIHRCAETLRPRGIRLVDAPVGKGPWAAEKGELTILAGGDDADIAAARGVLECLGSELLNCGALGDGQAVKLANNLVACGNLAVLAEAYQLLRATGASSRVLSALMPGTSADSWQLRHTVNAKIAAGDLSPMFKLGLATKDMRLALEAATDADLELPVTAATDELFRTTETAGHADNDWGAVVSQRDPQLLGEHDTPG